MPDPSTAAPVAYAVGHITVKDEALWREYCDKVPATLAPWGAEVVFRGAKAGVLCGEHRQDRIVVLRFPDRAAAAGWYASAAYQALIALRERAADVTLISYET